MASEPTPEELIEQPADAVEVERETRMTPAEATARMRIRVPPRAATGSSAPLIEHVNADDELKAWWHVSNVNAIGAPEHQRPLLGAHPDRHQHRAEAPAPADEARRRAERSSPTTASRRTTRRSSSRSARSCTTWACPCTATGTRTSASSSPSARRASCSTDLYELPERAVHRLRGAARDHEPPRLRQAADARGRRPAGRRRPRHGEGPLAHPVRARAASRSTRSRRRRSTRSRSRTATHARS